MVEFLGGRRLERRHLAALRIHARHHVLDRAVLAGGVHRLEDEQHGPAILRVEPVLQLREGGAPENERLLRARLLLGAQAAGVARIGVLQRESASMIDAIRARKLPGGLDDPFEVGRVVGHARARKT